MANKKPSYGKSSKGKKGKNNSSDTKKIIAILTVILVILLIIAIVLISIKGMWGEIIDIFKGMLDEDTPSGESPSGSISSGNIPSGNISSGNVSSGNVPSGNISSGNVPSGNIPSGNIPSGNAPNKPIPGGVAQLDGAIMEMRVLDIGQGDCILLLFPDGQVMVMDIGSEFGTTSPWNVINGALQELEITTIDYLFLTHTDYDHVRETKKLADNYQIKNFYLPVADIETSSTWRNSYNSALNETYIEDGITKKAEIHYNVGAYEISGENWLMKCYSFDEADYPPIKSNSSAENKNAVSPTCLLEYADRTIVLTGDSNEKSEKYLMGKGYFDNVDADVLKVGHHGSKSSTMMEFLNKVDCEYAIISCGAGNDYGHPTPEVLNRLDIYRDLVPDDDYNGFAQVYRTDEDGTVTVQIDEKGVINLIADENASKNTTTGTPIDEIGSGEITESGQVALIYIKYDIDYETLFAV